MFRGRAALGIGGRWGVDLEVTGVREIAHQHPGHPEWFTEQGADLHEGDRPRRQLDDHPALLAPLPAPATGRGDPGPARPPPTVRAGPAAGDREHRDHPPVAPVRIIWWDRRTP